MTSILSFSMEWPFSLVILPTSNVKMCTALVFGASLAVQAKTYIQINTLSLPTCDVYFMKFLRYIVSISVQDSSDSRHRVEYEALAGITVDSHLNKCIIVMTDSVERLSLHPPLVTYNCNKTVLRYEVNKLGKKTRSNNTCVCLFHNNLI